MADENPTAEKPTKTRPQKGAKTSRGRTRRAAKAKEDGAKGKPWTFPKHTLEEAIRVAKAIEEKNAGNPTRADMLARAVGFNHASDWRFRDLLKAARMYGLVSGSGARVTVGLEKIGQDVVAPISP